MLLDLQNNRDVDYDHVRQSDSDNASMGDASSECDDSMGDASSECDDSEGCYDDENDTMHAALGGASVPMLESVGVRALFSCL